MLSLVLTFVACLSDVPAGSVRVPHCEAVELPFDGSTSQCMMFGQLQMALWVREHDGWAPRDGWRCEHGRSI